MRNDKMIVLPMSCFIYVKGLNMRKKTIRFLAIILVVSLLLPSYISQAASKTYKGKFGSNITWTLSDNVLTISGKGEMDKGTWQYIIDKDTSDEIRKVVKIVVKEGITSIGEGAFCNMNNLKKVVLPKSLKVINQQAFLKSTKLSSVNFPKNLEAIKYNAFGHTALKKVKLPAKLKVLDSSVFSSCTKLKTIKFNENLETIKDHAISDTKITSVTITKNIKEISALAFSNNNNLKKITVESGNKYFAVDDGVLFNKDKTNLILYPAKKTGKSYEIPKKVTEISKYAFSYAAGLSSFTVESGNKAFSVEDGVLFSADKSKLMRFPVGKKDEEFTVPDSVKEICEYAFYRCKVEKVTLPDDLEKLDSYAFLECSKLKAISVPDKIFTVGTCAFSKCSSLENATVGDGAWYIESGAFMDCTNLKNVKIGKSCMSISDYAFQNCKNLETLVINSDKLTSGGIYRYTFENINPKAVISIKAPSDSEFESIKNNIISSTIGRAPETVTVKRIY